MQSAYDPEFGKAIRCKSV